VTISERLLEEILRRGFDQQMYLDLGQRATLPQAGQSQPSVLYVHIPFCESLCPFCSFHRVEIKQLKATAYFKALRQELRVIADKGYRPTIVYVGGGTPTILPDELAATLELIRTLFPIEQISIETNPNHLRDDILQILNSAGVDRLSVGIQTFDNALLRQMGRYVPYGSGELNRERLADAAGRVHTLNVDMIFNLPGQSEASLQRDLDILTNDLKVCQTSIYPLMNSRRTGKAMQESMGAYSLRNEKVFYNRLRDTMEKDYLMSSVWCFSRGSGLVDEYIIADTNYIGVGSGAFSYVDGTMYANTFAIHRYGRMIHETGSAITATRRLDDVQQARYDILMSLFGLSMKKNEHRDKLLRKEIFALQCLGVIEHDGENFRLTRRGQYSWLIMMREFFTGVNNFRDQMRAHIRAERVMHRDQS
jgi:coproporphyrinogen III oxidase-like Fe-S oxidoreductase